MSLDVIDDVSTEIDSSIPAVELTGDATLVDPVSDTGANALAAEQVAQEVVAPSYEANYKYSVRGQEKEVDEMFRALITDADKEKKIKEIFEKADGLDFVKGDRDSLKSEFKGFKEQITPYLSEYNKFTSLRDQGNLGAALQVAGITDDQLFEYCVQKLEMQSNPSQANLYKAHTESSLKQFEVETQLNHYKQQEQQNNEYRFNIDLDSAVTAQNDLASQVDQKLGKIGAFKEEVIAMGVYESQRGNILSVNDAVNAVANKYKPFITPQAQVIPQAPYKAPATMPNTGSSNVSVISQRPKSIDDLRKLQKEMVG
jgi:hypothetical protein